MARVKGPNGTRQRCVRAAHRFRQNLKLYIFSPFVWELETQLLGCLAERLRDATKCDFEQGSRGEKLKAHLPKDYTKQKIQQHRQAWATWEALACHLTFQQASYGVRVHMTSLMGTNQISVAHSLEVYCFF